MCRSIVIHLLLLVIFLCPFNCMGGLGCHLPSGKAKQFTARAIVSKCHCCHSPSSGVGSRPVDDLPIDDCPASGCENCICHGALLSAGLNDVDWQVSSGDYSFTADFFWQEEWLGSHIAQRVDLGNASFAQSGSFVRISHQSLLI